LLNNINYAYRKARFCWATGSDDGKTTPYLLNVTASDLGCPSKAVTFKSIQIYVHPNPAAQRIYSQDSLGKLTFESIHDNAANMIHEWIIRNSTNTGNPIYTSDKIKDSHVFSDSGTFVITYIITDTLINCDETYLDRVQVIKNNTSIQSLQTGQPKIFPNPAKDVVFIQSALFPVQNLKVYDVFGKVVFESEIDAYDIEISVSEWAQGAYIFEIKSNDTTHWSRIIILK
jgi:hypothetical protein